MPIPAIAPRLSEGFPLLMAFAIIVEGGKSSGARGANEAREISKAPEEIAPTGFGGGSSSPVIAKGSLSSGGGVADVVRGAGAGAGSSPRFSSSSFGTGCESSRSAPT
jgi:hypothetical protein